MEFLDQAFHRVLFNAMPMPVFVVDGDVSILEYNTAAARLVGANRRRVIGRMGGNVWKCLNALNTPEGCGHSASCPDCEIRKAVKSASNGKTVTRRWSSLETKLKGRTCRKDLRVTCQPVAYQQQSFVLLILEGLDD